MRPVFGDPCGPWIKPFAWLPCFTYDSGTVWLCKVWKRHIFKHQYLDGGGSDYWWQYSRFQLRGCKKSWGKTHNIVDKSVNL